MFKISKRLLVSAMLGAVLGCATPSPSRAQDFMPTRFSVEVRGVGPDVILIPGLGSSRDVWTAQVEQLAATHRVHLVQLAGFAGEPVAAPAGEVVGPFVEDLAAYIEANHIERPAIIGHSMGGLTGLILARRHPERVGELMIVDSLPFFSAMFGPQMTAAAVEPQARMMIRSPRWTTRRSPRSKRAAFAAWSKPRRGALTSLPGVLPPIAPRSRKPCTK